LCLREPLDLARRPETFPLPLPASVRFQSGDSFLPSPCIAPNNPKFATRPPLWHFDAASTYPPVFRPRPQVYDVLYISVLACPLVHCNAVLGIPLVAHLHTSVSPHLFLPNHYTADRCRPHRYTAISSLHGFYVSTVLSPPCAPRSRFIYMSPPLAPLSHCVSRIKVLCGCFFGLINTPHARTWRALLPLPLTSRVFLVVHKKCAFRVGICTSRPPPHLVSLRRPRARLGLPQPGFGLCANLTFLSRRFSLVVRLLVVTYCVMTRLTCSIFFILPLA